MRDKKIKASLWTGAVVFSFLLSMQTLFFPLSRRMDYNDSSIYQYIGYLICNGKAPYVDAFDHKGIYFYFLNALGYAINPKWGMWPLIWLSMLGNVALIYRLCRKFLERRFSILITLAVASGIGTSFWDGDTPDYFSVSFSLIAFSLLSDFFLSNTLQRKSVFLIGVALSVAFWMKPNMILGALVICAFLIMHFLLSKRFALAGMCVVQFSAGFALASVPAIVWLSAHGTLSAMFEDYFFFNFTYTSFNAELMYCFSTLAFFLFQPSVYVSLFLLLAALASILSKRRTPFKTPNNGMLLCGAASFFICLLHAASTGNEYPQYAMLFYPSVIYILIASVRQIRMVWTDKAQIIWRASVCVVCVVLFLNVLKLSSHCKKFWTEVPQENEERAYVIDNSNENDTIAMISPYYTGFYISTKRDSATKYIYIQAQHFADMDLNPEKGRAFWEEYARALEESKPRIILFERWYYEREELKGVLEILDDCLSNYVSAGESARFRFFVLPRSPEEEIHEFKSDTEIARRSGEIRVSQEMIDAYRRGEITVDDILEALDNESP